MKKMNDEIVALKKKMEQMEDSFREDIEFAIRTELAWREVEEGKCRKMSKEEFL